MTAISSDPEYVINHLYNCKTELTQLLYYALMDVPQYFRVEHNSHYYATIYPLVDMKIFVENGNIFKFAKVIDYLQCDFIQQLIIRASVNWTHTRADIKHNDVIAIELYDLNKTVYQIGDKNNIYKPVFLLKQENLQLEQRLARVEDQLKTLIEMFDKKGM
jgi:hypothetical protein